MSQLAEYIDIGESDSDGTKIGYQMYSVRGTNAYILFKKKHMEADESYLPTCVCSFWVMPLLSNEIIPTLQLCIIKYCSGLCNRRGGLLCFVMFICLSNVSDFIL